MKSARVHSHLIYPPMGRMYIFRYTHSIRSGEQGMQ